MDHLSSMKRKNVVLVYNLLLEMLDANTSSSSSSQQSSPPSSDCFSEPFQYPEPPARPGRGRDQGRDRDRTFADNAPAPPSEAPPLRSSPPFQSLLAAHMDEE